MLRAKSHPIVRILQVALVLSLVTVLAGCNSIAALWGGGTVKVTDGMGREIEVPRRISRVVSMAPGITEMLFALGAGDKLVGVDVFSDYPEAALDVPRIGDYHAISVEAVVAAKPDVVLASTIHKTPVEQLEQLGIKCLVIEPRSIDDVCRDLELLAGLLGREDAAKGVVSDIRAKLAGVAAKLAGVPEEQRPLVFYEVWDDPLMTAGANTYTNEVIVLAGGRNLGADLTGDYPMIGFEVVVARNPEAIVFPTFHGGVPLTPERLAQRPGWAAVSAVRDGRIHGIDADIMARGGPRLADAVVEMARLLYPELFE